MVTTYEPVILEKTISSPCKLPPTLYDFQLHCSQKPFCGFAFQKLFTVLYRNTAVPFYCKFLDQEHTLSVLNIFFYCGIFQQWNFRGQRKVVVSVRSLPASCGPGLGKRWLGSLKQGKLSEVALPATEAAPVRVPAALSPSLAAACWDRAGEAWRVRFLLPSRENFTVLLQV